MYQELFQSPNRPFRATPDTTYYFAHDSIAAARQTIVRAMLRAEGPAMVLGGAGLGKSLLAELVTQDVRDRLDVVRLHAARLCSRRALLQNILFELGLPYRELSEGELRLSILDRLQPSSDTAPDGVLLIVDEAHTLPAKLLDELRLINNYTRDNQPRTRLLLFGNMRLEDTFTQPQLDSFSQRLAARCYLQPMTKRDTLGFVCHQLTVAGVATNEVITHEGLEAVYAASEGVPRLANQIMDHALMLAIDSHQSPISAALIEESWADLQQLPAPWHTSHEKANGAGLGAESSAIEFGALDDLEDEIHEEEDLLQREMHVVRAASDADPATASGHASAESLDEEVSPLSEQNFFAAFTPPGDDEEFAESMQDVENQEEMIEGTEDEEVEQDVARELPLAPRHRPVLAELGEDDEAPQDVSSAPVDSVVEGYFAGRPTDDELLAFEDEQAQYDAMGVWENDPPLARLSAILPHADTPCSETAEEADAETSMDFAPSTQPRLALCENLFGDDFDEEISVPVSSLLAASTVASRASAQPTPVGAELPNGFVTLLADAQSSESEPRSAEAATVLEGGPEAVELVAGSEASEYVARIQAYADAILRSNAGAPTVEEVVTLNGELAENEIPQAWRMATTSVDEQHALQIANDIEDLVSQLNFSSFAVEPYSIEQISLESPAERSAPVDSIRSGENAEIYMLHRAQSAESQSIFSADSADYDDDRDLLIVEEDLPVSSKLTDVIAAETPVTQTSPYTQLFAKLRK